MIRTQPMEQPEEPKAKYGTTAILDCGHELLFTAHPPVKTQKMWCVRCEDYSIVIALNRGAGYKSKCYSCRYNRSWGIAKLAAERAIARHRMKNPRHRMALLDADGNELWKVGDEAQPELPLDPDEPPF